MKLILSANTNCGSADLLNPPHPRSVLSLNTLLEVHEYAAKKSIKINTKNNFEKLKLYQFKIKKLIK